MTHGLPGLRHLVAAALLASLSLPATPQCGVDWQPGPPAAGPDNGVTCLVRLPNGDLIAGGLFELADSALAPHVARWDGTAWTALGGGVDDLVYCLAVLPNGDVLAGGRFENADGAPASHLARWNGIAWSQFAGGCNGDVRALFVLPNGDVLAGGVFTAAGGTPAAAIARWDGSTWTALGTGLAGTSASPGTVGAIAQLNNGDLVAGGQFTLTGATPFLALARWDGASWHTLVNATGGDVTGVARVLAVLQNGDLLAGGSMNYSSSVSAQSLLRWDGTAAHVVATPVLSPFAIALAGNGDVVLGGYSLPNLPLAQAGVATWNGTTWTPLPNVPTGVVQALAHDASGRIVAGRTPLGSFQTAPAVQRWDGATWTTVGAPTPPRVNALLRANDGAVFVGGEFTSFRGTAANNVVRWRDGVWSPLGSGLDGRVKSMTLAPNGDLIVSGDFTTAGGAPANRVARWNGFAWSTVGAGLPEGADRLAATVTGEVFAAPGSTLWRFDGAQWAFVTLPLGGSIHDLAALPNGDLLLGGRLGGYFPQPVESSVWRWSAGTVAPLSGGLYEVNDLLVAADGSVTAVGQYGVATWSGGVWTMIASLPTYNALSWVTTLPNGDLLVGGDFTALGSAATQNLARWDGTWHAVQHAGIDGPLQIGAVAADGTLFVAGTFTEAGPHVAWNFAMGNAVCPPAASIVGAGCTGGAGPLALQANNLPWTGDTFVSTATGFTTTSLGAHVIGVQPIVTPLPGGSPGCWLFVNPLLIDLLIPVAGAATASFAIPADVALAGITLRTQVAGIEIDPTLGIVRITSTNALDLTIGAY